MICSHSGTWAFMIIFLIYPSTSSTVLFYFQCTPVEGGLSYLRADFSIDCNSSQYTTWLIYAWAMVFVYPIGVPLLYWLLLMSHGDKLRAIEGVEILQAKLKQAEEAEAFHHSHDAGLGDSAHHEHGQIRHANIVSRIAELGVELEMGKAALPGYLNKLT